MDTTIISQNAQGKDVDSVIQNLVNSGQNLDIRKVPNNSATTCDYVSNRIRVFYDKDTNKVTKTQIG